MPLRRFRRQYEQLSQFETGRIISMMKVGCSTRRVARQLGPSDCVTSRREDCNIVRNGRIRPPDSSAAIQAQSGERGNWTAAEWNQVVFRDESRFNLSNDENRVRVWRPHGECLNSAFALQRHTAPTTGVMVWGVIAYNTRSPLVLIRGTKAA
ncbi:transposable element Tcb2 transposase [Trichonephila clavipes]|nr:transposable element Tcb2 transposase [Trichonephila clavipes]